MSGGRPEVNAEREVLAGAGGPVEIVRARGWNPTTRDGPAADPATTVSGPRRRCPGGRFLAYCGGEGRVSPRGRTEGNAALSLDSLRVDDGRGGEDMTG